MAPSSIVSLLETQKPQAQRLTQSCPIIPCWISVLGHHTMSARPLSLESIWKSICDMAVLPPDAPKFCSLHHFPSTHRGRKRHSQKVLLLRPGRMCYSGYLFPFFLISLQSRAPLDMEGFSSSAARDRQELAGATALLSPCGDWQGSHRPFLSLLSDFPSHRLPLNCLDGERGC